VIDGKRSEAVVIVGGQQQRFLRRFSAQSRRFLVRSRRTSPVQGAISLASPWLRRSRPFLGLQQWWILVGGSHGQRRSKIGGQGSAMVLVEIDRFKLLNRFMR
jgi:hypothetical protein